VFECVVNISEGRDTDVLRQLARASGASLRDVHADEYHHRSVFTLINEPGDLQYDVRSLIGAAFERLDLTTHDGVHPRFGVVDVVPFVALEPEGSPEALAMREELAQWIASSYNVPVFFYGQLDDGTIRSLPDVRRGAFTSITPDAGPSSPSRRLGSVALGVRPILVAWNIWLQNVTLQDARRIASAVRQGAVRSLAFSLGEFVQVSCNIIDANAATLSSVYDQVLGILPRGGRVDHCELVGLLPASMLESEDPSRWGELGIARELTIEARLA
jgi:glutamate formiminotransferase/glutamate formiminotransferase/formiminotetrahydrofolate cyclodeaminase